MMHAEPPPGDLIRFLRGNTDASTFRHADHIRMAFEILRRHDFPDAAAAFARSLKQIAARAGTPAKYHETITMAFLSLIAERSANVRYTGFESFIEDNCDLLDASILRRWYAPGRLASGIARRTFVLPDPHP